jgi:thioredoxin-related protein
MGAVGRLAAVLAVGMACVAVAWPGSPPSQQQEIYDTKADANAQIAAAQTRAQRDHQRVLLMFGGNWCGWCVRLHGVLTGDEETARLLRDEYQLVMVDVGRFDRHMDIADRYGVELKKSGVPFLVVLDAEGEVLARQETGSLEKGKGHDVKKVRAFLRQWQSGRLEAEQVLAAGLTRARAEDKRVLLRLGAPRCPWCRRLDEVLLRAEIAEVLGADYVDVRIDVDRMVGGKQLAERLRATPQGGIPWCAVLDGDGRVLATSDGPEGNVGCPVTAGEIAHFVAMLRETARRIQPEVLAGVNKALEEHAREVQAEQAASKPVP